MIKVRTFLKLLAALGASGGLLPTLREAQAATGSGKPLKVFRYAFLSPETSFDPAVLSDLYSRTITPHIFEALYTYDHLARPAKVVPLTADGMPEFTPDFKVWTVKVKPGIHFASDPAFNGKRRELTANDYLYVIRRFADPANKSPNWSGFELLEISGLNEYREEVVKQRKAFDYDHPIDGLRLLDRYTLQIRLNKPSPNFIETLAGSDLMGAVAREVVEKYGEHIGEHPVGTGPFVLAEWRRSSFIALNRNPEYRERYYDAQPAPDDAQGQALLARFKGRRLPMVDRVEISVVEESQPRWLSFLSREADLIERVPEEFINVAVPGGQVAPNLARKGVRAYRELGADAVLTYFNMEDPVVGGYTPEKVALRRAIALAVDLEAEIRVARRGQAIPAQSIVVPNTTGYDPDFRSENSEYNPARAKALLDMYGYVDRNGDGWRELPDGSPLVLEKATQPEARYRVLDELWKKNLDAVGIRTVFKPAKWPENLKAARAGKLQLWGVGSSAAGLDGQGALARLYGPESGGGNLARFKLKEFDAIYDRMTVIPNGPERSALFLKAKEYEVAYMPYKVHAHRIITDMTHPWLIGYRRPPLWTDFWQFIDIDDNLRRTA